MKADNLDITLYTLTEAESFMLSICNSIVEMSLIHQFPNVRSLMLIFTSILSFSNVLP